MRVTLTLCPSGAIIKPRVAGVKALKRYCEQDHSTAPA